MTLQPDRSPRFGARLLALCASAAAVVLVSPGCNVTAGPKPEPVPPRVVVVAAEKRTLPVVVNPIGTTRALEDVTIRARVKGFLKEKHFKDGGQVEPGQLLLVIDPVPFELALKQADAELQAAKAALRKADASREPQVANAQLDLDRSQTLLDQVEERRARTLLARRAGSQEDYDKADAQLKKSTAQLEADKAKLEQSRADYDINIDNAKAQVASAEADVDNAKVNLGYTRMFAPIAGRIGELKVKVGNLVGDGSATELVTIQQLDPMGLDFRPSARYLPFATALLSKGLPVSLTVEGDRVHPHVGKAIFIDNTVDSATSTFLMRAEVANPDGSLLPGQYVRAGMTVGEYVDAGVVPEQAVVEGQEGARVYTVGAGNKVEAVKVKPIDQYRGLRVLESGLEPGRKVIVEGIQLVRAGQVVDAVEAPLEHYIRDTEAPTTLDRRFLSPVTRMPGMPSDASGTPRDAKGTGAPGEAAPKAGPQPPPKPAPETPPKPQPKGS
jgi:membrane fusion protein, multidrug efflux system